MGIIVNKDTRGEFTRDWTTFFSGSLVKDIYTIIFNHLAELGKPKDLVRCMRVCKGWFDLLDPKKGHKSEEIWKTAFKKIARDCIDPNQIDGYLQGAEQFLGNRILILEMHVQANLKHLDSNIKSKFENYQVKKGGHGDRKNVIKRLKVRVQKAFRIQDAHAVGEQSYNRAANALITLHDFQTRFPSIENSPSDKNPYYEYLKINAKLECCNSKELQEFYFPVE